MATVAAKTRSGVSATTEQNAHPSGDAPQPARKPRKETRTADGDGSLCFDAKRKLWVGTLMVGWKPDPKDPKRRKRDHRRVAAKRQDEARKKLQQLRQEHLTGTMPEKTSRDSLAGFVERWLAVKKGNVRLRTHERYSQLLRRHVVPSLGTTKPNALKPDQLQRLYAAKLEEGLSPRTVHHVHRVLHTALEDAVRWGYTGRNVAHVVTPPAVPTRELQPPTGLEVGRLLDCAVAVGDRYQALWALAAFTGMRLGELLGLTWEYVDLDAGRLRVRRILVDVKRREPVWGEPKTKRSRRDVDLPEEAIDALRGQQDRQRFEKDQLDEDYGAYGLVFATQLGGPVQRKVVQEAFKRALDRADLPLATRFHDLRHAAATMMLGSGEDVPTVAAVLGHSKNSTTLDIYAHAIPEKVRKATSAIQRAVRGAR